VIVSSTFLLYRCEQLLVIHTLSKRGEIGVGHCHVTKIAAKLQTLTQRVSCPIQAPAQGVGAG